jgi:hypothetical protein
MRFLAAILQSLEIGLNGVQKVIFGNRWQLISSTATGIV